MWLERTDKIRSEMGEREQNLAAAKLELELAEEDIKRLENEEEKAAQEGYELLRRKGEAEAEISAGDASSAEATGRKAVIENEFLHLDARIEECSTDTAVARELLESACEEEKAAECGLEKAKNAQNDADETKKKLVAEYNNAVFD